MEMSSEVDRIMARAAAWKTADGNNANRFAHDDLVRDVEALVQRCLAAERVAKKMAGEAKEAEHQPCEGRQQGE